MATTPFEVAQRCVDKKERFTSSEETSLNYMSMRFLSMHRNGFMGAVIGNESSHPNTRELVLPIAQRHCWKGPAPFFKYIKGKEVKLTEKQKNLVHLLMVHLHISKESAIDTLHLLQDTGFDFDKAFGQRAKVGKSSK